MTTKAEVLADRSLMQRACSAYVHRYVYYCLTTLFYEIGQLDYDAQVALFDDMEPSEAYMCYDWERPVEDFICEDADMGEVEDIAERVGYWSEFLHQSGVPEVREVEDKDEGDEDTSVYTYYTFDGADEEFTDEDEAVEAARETVSAAIRLNICRAITNSDDYEEIGRDYNLDPDENDVYEHWLVDGYFASQLRERGEKVFDFCNMTVWGRCATGQSISMDGVINRIVSDLPDYHWVWSAK